MEKKLRNPTAKIRVVTELQYYDDGSCAVLKSFNIPISEKVKKEKKPKFDFKKKKEPKFDFSSKSNGEVVL